MRGGLVVIEGIDGSGKKTQWELLVARLRKEGVSVTPIDFPRYGRPSAYFVEEYLNGAYGPPERVPPRVAALFYALDRYDAARELKGLLARGELLVANRYTTSSLGHQGGKLPPRERAAFLSFVERLEYEELSVPRPDLVILLKVEPVVAHQLIALKEDRGYLRGKSRDVHEESLAHLSSAAETYLSLAEQESSWAVVDCMREGLDPELLRDPSVTPSEKVRSIAEVHELVWRRVQDFLS